MSNIFSLSEISKKGEFDADSMLRQYKLDVMARFMEIQSTNQGLRQDEIAEMLGFSSSSLLRYRHDLNMFSP